MIVPRRHIEILIRHGETPPAHPAPGGCRGQSIGLSVCRSVDLSVSRSVGLSVCRSVGQSVSRSVGLSVCRSVGLSVCRWLKG